MCKIIQLNFGTICDTRILKEKPPYLQPLAVQSTWGSSPQSQLSIWKIQSQAAEPSSFSRSQSFESLGIPDELVSPGSSWKSKN